MLKVFECQSINSLQHSRFLIRKHLILLHGAMHASWKRVGDDNDDDNDYDDEYENDGENDMNDNYDYDNADNDDDVNDDHY